MIYTVARELPGTLSTMAAPQGDLDAILLSLRSQGVDTLVSLLPPDQTTMLSSPTSPTPRTGPGWRSARCRCPTSACRTTPSSPGRCASCPTS